MSHFNLLGIPVDGTITRPDPAVEQRPLSDLEPLIRAILADDTIVEFGWTQYTPYFNDGQPCVFGIRNTWFRTVDDPAPDPQESWQLRVEGTGHPSIGGRPSSWENRKRNDGDYIGPDEERHSRALALSDALYSRAFDEVLLESFGEHAHITIRRAGITVDSYSHQ